MPQKENRSWKATRQLVIERSLGWCEECGKFRGEHVHHKQYWPDGRRGGEPLEWLVYLCLLCHGAKHPKHKFYPRFIQLEIAGGRKKGKKKAQRKKARTKKKRPHERTDHGAKLAETANWDFRQKLLSKDYWGRYDRAS